MKGLELEGNQAEERQRPPDVGPWAWAALGNGPPPNLTRKVSGAQDWGVWWWEKLGKRQHGGATDPMWTQSRTWCAGWRSRWMPGHRSSNLHFLPVCPPLQGFCRHSHRLNQTNRSPKTVKKEWLCKQLLFFHIHARHTHLSLIHSKSFIIGMNVWQINDTRLGS